MENENENELRNGQKKRVGPLEEEIYSMSNRKRGICVVFNNTSFSDPHLSS